MNDITFFTRFQADILAGLKTITIRDASEAHFQPGQVLTVGRVEDDVTFCQIEVRSITLTTLDRLTEDHAQQENMSLDVLRSMIKDIYPHQSQFYVIAFICLHAH